MRAATPGRTGAAAVAADLRPNPETSTDTPSALPPDVAATAFRWRRSGEVDSSTSAASTTSTPSPGAALSRAGRSAASGLGGRVDFEGLGRTRHRTQRYRRGAGPSPPPSERPRCRPVNRHAGRSAPLHPSPTQGPGTQPPEQHLGPHEDLKHATAGCRCWNGPMIGVIDRLLGPHPLGRDAKSERPR